MARVKGAMMTRKRRNKVLKMAKGYWGAKSKHFKMANQQVMKSLTYAYTGRRLKKRDFRRLWITRISAACKQRGMNYSTFVHGLKNAGVVIEHGVRYATDGVSQAVFTALCQKAGVPVQHFANRSDLPGGGTLGLISTSHVSVNTVDVGLAQLAMHSCYETAGTKDTDYLVQAMTAFYAASFREEDGRFTLSN